MAQEVETADTPRTLRLTKTEAELVNRAAHADRTTAAHVMRCGVVAEARRRLRKHGLIEGGRQKKVQRIRKRMMKAAKE